MVPEETPGPDLELGMWQLDGLGSCGQQVGAG